MHKFQYKFFILDFLTCVNYDMIEKLIYYTFLMIKNPFHMLSHKHCFLPNH